MSRIGKLPITIPQGVTVTINAQAIVVKGPKGELSWTIPEGVILHQEEGVLTTVLSDAEKKNLRGLSRSIVFNMVEGVTQGFEKKLHVLGVGFGVKVQGQKLLLNLGFSHPVEHVLPKGINAAAEKDAKGNDILTLQGIDKQLLGEQAAKIRAYRKPEPYKGKGVRYFGEYVKTKAGKTAGKK